MEERERFSREAMTYLDHLYRVALHITRDPEEAQDLVQETYARALAAYKQFTPGTNLKAWLTRILYNFFSDQYRRRKKWVSVELAAPEEGRDSWERIAAANPGPESEVLAQELSDKIAAALERLPEEFRVPIILVDMGDFSYAETAEILACPVGTVRSRLSRGRRLLQLQLRKYVAA